MNKNKSKTELWILYYKINNLLYNKLRVDETRNKKKNGRLNIKKSTTKIQYKQIWITKSNIKQNMGRKKHF
jgi:hypothetical protein